MIGSTVAHLRGALGTGPYDKHLVVRDRPVHIHNRGPDSYMGRFGGGWEFKVGIQMGRRGLAGAVILNLGRSFVRIDPRKKAA